MHKSYKLLLLILFVTFLKLESLTPHSLKLYGKEHPGWFFIFLVLCYIEKKNPTDLERYKRIFIVGLTIPLTSDVSCHTSSAQFATVLLLTFLLLSGAWLQVGDQKDGLTLTQRKVVVPSHQIVSYINVLLSSQWTHGQGLKDFQNPSQALTPAQALFQWNRVDWRSACPFLTTSLLSTGIGYQDQLKQRSFILW